MNEGESSASTSNRPPRHEILAIAHSTSKSKDRSLDTAGRHLETVKHRGHEVEVCLLGDSMVERMSTTGQWGNLEPWPSTTMLPDSNANALEALADHDKAEDSAGRMPPRDDILAVAQRTSKFKDRSLDTARCHLETMSNRGEQEVEVCLIGGSNIERMSTTGQWETLQPWPSTTMLPDSKIDALNAGAGDNAAPIYRRPGVANFGCGGDKIENVLFRVIGDQAHDLRGLANELHPAGGSSTQPRPKLWVVHAGTNNLHPKKGLNAKSLESMEVLLRTLYHLTGPGPRFLLTGLFYRTDVPNELVDKANVALRNLVFKLQEECPGEQSHGPNGTHPAYHKKSQSDDGGVEGLKAQPNTFEFLEAPEMNPDGGWLDDHVHLNQDGYRKWMEKLVPKVEHMLRK